MMIDICANWNKYLIMIESRLIIYQLFWLSDIYSSMIFADFHSWLDI